MRCRPVDQENSIRWSRAWLKCLTRQNRAGPVWPSASRRLAGKRGAGICRKGRGRIILSGLSGSAKGPLFLADDSDDVNSLHQHRSRQGWLVVGRVASFPACSRFPASARLSSGRHGPVLGLPRCRTGPCDAKVNKPLAIFAGSVMRCLEVEICTEMLFSVWLGISYGLEVCDDSETSYPWCWQNAPALHFHIEIRRRKATFCPHLYRTTALLGSHHHQCSLSGGMGAKIQTRCQIMKQNGIIKTRK